jgi:AraC-like DNA-binding protein
MGYAWANRTTWADSDMGRRTPTQTGARPHSTFEPLVALLQQELDAAGITCPRPRTRTPRQFASYYLEVVQLLEAQVAAGDDHPPMSRTEVELMCRCALSGATLADAIALCVKYCAMIHPRAGRPALALRGDTATFTFNSLRRESSTAASLVDITGLFAFHQLFQWLVGVEFPLLQVGIGPTRRDDVLAFLKLFRAPVLAGGDSYALTFRTAVLKLPVVRGSHEFDAFFAVFPCGVFEPSEGKLPEQVLALLHAWVRQGDGLPGQRALASSLGISLSTFRRRLAEAGATFRQLREQCLCRGAEELLGGTDLPINEISARLGFSDTPAFRRAFRQWTGVAPGAWRTASFRAVQ